jgi:predicted enzyme related to lactoylglutathione lyase
MTKQNIAQENVVGIHMAWVVVDDLEKAVKFYTETLGLSLLQLTKEYGWAELSGPSGTRLGLAELNEQSEKWDGASVKPGDNAVVTITVKDIDAASQSYLEKGVRLLGKVMEVPGEVKLQTFQDPYGNVFQLAELLRELI